MPLWSFKIQLERHSGALWSNSEPCVLCNTYFGGFLMRFSAVLWQTSSNAYSYCTQATIKHLLCTL